MSSLFGIAAGGQSEFYPFKIGNSLRFDDGSSADLSRTPSSAGNEQIFTISCWVKRGSISSRQVLFSPTNSAGNDFDFLEFQSSDTIRVVGNNASASVQYQLITSALFRDVSAWYNIVVAYDTTQATASNRIKLYVNGTQITAFSTSTYPPLNYDTRINTAQDHRIGSAVPASSSIYFDGYMAEFNLIDGQALDPSSFGETKSGVWIPKNTSGLTFGTNGFRLEFGDSSAIGDDTSGLSNDFTANNLATSDVTLDSPTNNFATLNPLIRASTYGLQSDPAPSNGNLHIAMPGGTNNIAVSTFELMPPNKYRAQFTLTSRGSSTNFEIGVGSTNKQISSASVRFNSSGFISVDGSTVQSSLTSANTVGDAVEILVDLENDTVKFALKEDGSSTWASLGIAQAISANVTNPIVWVREQGSNNISGTMDFGQLGYVGSDDNNYNPMSTLYLPEPTFSPLVDDIPEDYFNTVLYTGDDSTSQAVTGVGFQPDFVWLKSRTSAVLSHAVLDSVRGVNKSIFPDDTGSENSGVVFPSFDSDGFTVSDSGGNWTNEDSNNFVAWNWIAGGTPTASNSAGAGNAPTSGSVMIDGVASSANLAGTIPATKISANTEAGFSIVSYTGNATAGATVAHGLGGTPEMMIVKRRGAIGNWFVFHHQANGVNSSDPETDYFVLEEPNARADNANPWNDTAPTSTVFTIGASGWTNSADTYIAYLFRSIQGFSKVGAYDGLGSTNGTYVYTGFRPSFILGKRSNASVNWFIHDNKRDIDNFTIHRLFPDSPGAENSSEAESTYGIDFLSNGFKIRASHTSTGASDAYIYMAFAEMPFKYANAR